jgi:hypothetical protein
MDLIPGKLYNPISPLHKKFKPNSVLMFLGEKHDMT